MMWIVLGVLWLAGFAISCGMFKSWGDQNTVYAAIWPLWVPPFLLLLTYELVGGFVSAMRENWRSGH
jgi:hypothetical protein